jgi:hypothetical protein
VAKRRHEKNVANYEKADRPGGERESEPPPLSFAFVWTSLSVSATLPDLN